MPPVELSERSPSLHRDHPNFRSIQATTPNSFILNACKAIRYRLLPVIKEYRACKARLRNSEWDCQPPWHHLSPAIIRVTHAPTESRSNIGQPCCARLTTGDVGAFGLKQHSTPMHSLVLCIMVSSHQVQFEE
ncbi:lactose regulatory protein LAC9 and GAL4-like protein [Pseudozyma hubeiensis SY62]|uniref:Lactose regulatory protein LAC9 and GAL4-like protein n=1 Tax=Pseudozyma hubeiensis (strain SY62) TaxID=1305764 RepID=R9PDM9_PSEHS|nr:lactose regulatory protein LAC9 and GAL4-like protein [Pseudozyma hubeiensis SY62]GAC99461.1 lactose regulatory protein LAC9 and GAL4-like protein [Pseudozyma hubeiensis SY62]